MGDRLSDERLTEIEGRLSNPDLPRWPYVAVARATEFRIDGAGRDGPFGLAEVDGIYPDNRAEALAQLFAHSPADVADLLAEVRRLRGERDRLIAYGADWYEDRHGGTRAEAVAEVRRECGIGEGT